MAVTHEGGSQGPVGSDGGSLYSSSGTGSISSGAQQFSQTAQPQESNLAFSNYDRDIRASVSPLPTAPGQASNCGGVQGAIQRSVQPPSKREDVRSAEDGDAFLNASMQLLHLNGEARQRVRQLWTSVQRLGRENQITEAGMDLLYTELGNVLKNLGAEKLEPPQPLKTGHLVLLPSIASDVRGSVGGGSAVKALFGSRPSPQLMRCTLSEDQSKLEMVPVRQDHASSRNTSAASSTGGTAPTSLGSGRFGLPTTASLIGIISDAFQEEPASRVIRLQGCQVRRLVPKSSCSDSSSGDSNSAQMTKTLHRFQLLVPYKTLVSMDGAHADTLFPTITPVPYESLIFEVPETSEDAQIATDAEVEEWVDALDRVCRFQLHRLEHALREAPTIDRYRETLLRYFPVCVSLSWLHNRSDQQTQLRRASANLSMIQIVKDLGRDQVLLDDRLFSAGSTKLGSSDIESDSVSEVVKYLVTKILDFEHDVTAYHKAAEVSESSGSPPQQPSSPMHRFANNSEARALAFVERVLQGSSRTQSGGDIYDAISFFCQQEHVSICPVSHEARPVQMNLIADVPKGIFQVKVQVCMRFKVIELTPRSTTRIPAATGLNEGVVDAPDTPNESVCEWAVIEGTLSRQFTLGQLPANGTVTIAYLP